MKIIYCLLLFFLPLYLSASIINMDIKSIKDGARVVVQLNKAIEYKKVYFNHAQSLVIKNTSYNKDNVKLLPKTSKVSAVRVINNKKNTYILFESHEKLDIQTKIIKKSSKNIYLIISASVKPIQSDSFKTTNKFDNNLKNNVGKSIMNINYSKYFIVMGMLFVLVIALFVFRNRLNRKSSTIFGKGNNDIRLIDSRYIDNKNKIMHIKVKEKNYIVLNNENGNLLLDKEYYENDEDIATSDFDKIYGNARQQSDKELRK